MSGDIFGCHNWGRGATGIEWVEARDPAEHPPMHRTAPHPNNKELGAQNVNSAKVEKPCSETKSTI